MWCCGFFVLNLDKIWMRYICWMDSSCGGINCWGSLVVVIEFFFLLDLIVYLSIGDCGLVCGVDRE